MYVKIPRPCRPTELCNERHEREHKLEFVVESDGGEYLHRLLPSH